MTISDQLSFSILSAPVASADRRVLSQAWYSALYREAPKREREPARGGAIELARAGTFLRTPDGAAIPLRTNAAAQRIAATGRAIQPAAIERRAPRMRLAWKIQQLAAARAFKRASATFVVDGTNARVRILVTSGGGRVHLIAVCAKKVEAAVAAALAQARYAAAVSGMTLHAESRADAQC